MKFTFGLILFFSTLVYFAGPNAYGAKIQFPEEELASESVWPKFDNPEPVKNRNIITEKHLELTGFFGWTLNDAFVNPINFGGIFTYHFTEFSAIQIYATKLSAKENSYPSQIQAQTGKNIGPTVAIPKAAYALAYQITPFYGKLSITKQGVINMSLYGDVGLGEYQFQDSSSSAVSLGLGSKFYFSQHWNARVDYRFFFFDGRDPIAPTNSKKFQLNSILTLGLGFLL